ncbi:hypothetical protein MYSTI_01964 [Myxococcus stipitatus DSM 14675]|uniref:HD domain-containing protein n=1 Tax=Myxococcus stipitatus (strain DSM 14675 / JCM 12634 / Mx s8) TaxID=1278073 RepID=L7U587_MYXSD|nr:YfbR-like 5'-deoxynucleotidase [Myxococcus stipitatus]AGC43293.1 hypothetical protein MYSTI_01964 [Myxococcus stipitatus DSM 14675]
MDARRGDWIQTYTLKQFWPLDPRPEDVDIQDIGHALSMQCRFTGHCHTFYSVAEHCVRVSERAGTLMQQIGGFSHDVMRAMQWGLLHDAAEAYLVDLARPVKHDESMAAYRRAERQVMIAVRAKFGLVGGLPDEVKDADNDLLWTEARDLFPSCHPAWTWRGEPLAERIQPMTQPEAKAAFLARFSVLFGAEVAR